MAIFTTPESARHALADAEASMKSWESKHAAAVKEREALEADSLQRILEDPSQAEHYAFKDATLISYINTYAKAIDAARTKILERHEDLLKVEAKHEDKLATAAAKECEKHEAKVKTVLDALEKLQGAEYVVKIHTDWKGQAETIQPKTKADLLTETADAHKYRAQVIRDFLETGEIHNNNYGLGTLPGLGKFNPAKHIPASVRAAKAAGLKQEVPA